MSGLYTKTSTMAWLETQMVILDSWISDVATNPQADLDLLDCIEGHRNWLNTELKVLRNPQKYRFERSALPG
ncbi:MAG: hypothetical protein ACSHXY_10590 [Alphaproteobacteria bacterium]